MPLTKKLLSFPLNKHTKGLHLRLPVCRPHHCVHCGSLVGKLGTHGLSYQFSKGWHPRHAGVNNVIKRSWEAPGWCLRCALEGRALVWDATCPATLANSYQQISVREAGSVAAEAERRKRLKYANLNFSYFFVPVAVETLGVIGPASHAFLRNLAGRVRRATKEPLVHQYILQHLSVAVQHRNAIAIRGTSKQEPCEEFPCLYRAF